MEDNEQKLAFIAEDEEEMAYLIQFMLEREGYTVIHANDGQQASDLIQNSPPPLFALLDVMMPFKDGFQLLAEIRAKETWGHCPVIMLTAKGQGTDITRALDNGADDYIVKPFEPNELLARIKKLTRK